MTHLEKFKQLFAEVGIEYGEETKERNVFDEHHYGPIGRKKQTTVWIKNKTGHCSIEMIFGESGQFEEIWAEE